MELEAKEKAKDEDKKGREEDNDEEQIQFCNDGWTVLISVMFGTSLMDGKERSQQFGDDPNIGG